MSTAPEWDAAQVARLGRRLGYHVIWADQSSVLPVVDQVRNARVEAVIVPAPDHLGPLALNWLMGVTDVETVLPRLSFARWTAVGAGQ
ncbi:hypothetical protein [Nocardia callitridis]|uniref:hypothetical protein n=1 Tax=Nocardia callitridis TaxID=648753 RepID=UPI0031EDCD91